MLNTLSAYLWNTLNQAWYGAVEAPKNPQLESKRELLESADEEWEEVCYEEIPPILQEKNLFSSVLDNYKDGENGHLVSKEHNFIVLPWTRSELPRILEEITTRHFPTQFYKSCSIKEHEFFVIGRKDGSIKVLDPSQMIQIAKGACAKVYHIFDVMTGKLGPVYRKVYVDNLWFKEEENANTILEVLNKEDRAPGIPKMKLVYKGNSIQGSISRYHNMGDLAQINPVTISKENGVRGLRQLLQGLTHIFRCGIVHTDIKPRNIVVDRQYDGAMVFTYIDFGTAFQMKEMQEGRVLLGQLEKIQNGVKKIFQGIGYGYTKGFITKADYSAIDEAWTKRDWATYRRLQHARDVYALGVTFSELFEGENIPQAILVILEKMKCIASKRFTAEEALQHLEEAMQKSS